jgi:hypothetical protein
MLGRTSRAQRLAHIDALISQECSESRLKKSFIASVEQYGNLTKSKKLNIFRFVSMLWLMKSWRLSSLSSLRDPWMII